MLPPVVIARLEFALCAVPIGYAGTTLSLLFIYLLNTFFSIFTGVSHGH